ncbi:MAG: hypoxanthine phosphoribosyltransferase [Chlamydiota bacterium]
MMNNLELLHSSQEIEQAICQIAATLNEIYKDKDPIIIGVLKGSICFVSDLIRKLSFPFTLEFIRAKSYGLRGDKPQEVTVEGVDFDISRKDVIVIDDIFDRGETLHKIIDELNKHHPSSIKSVLLLRKKSKKMTFLEPDYTLLDIEDKFVIGYGLDYKEHYRGLDGIYAFKSIP